MTVVVMVVRAILFMMVSFSVSGPEVGLVIEAGSAAVSAPCRRGIKSVSA